MCNTFSENLSFLSEHNPTMRNILTSHLPEKIIYKDKPYKDLIVNGEPFYAMDAEVACSQQVQLFFKNPTHYSLKLKSRKTNRIHQNTINKTNTFVKELGYFSDGKPNISNLVLLGSGLGLHIEKLQAHLSFKHIILVEPDDDMLFYFFSHINLKQLVEDLQRNGGTLQIIKPKDFSHYEDMLSATMKKVGFDFLSEVTIFRHYETDLFNRIYANFKKTRARLLSAWGFFEDEVIGLRHTIRNIRHCQVICSRSQILQRAPMAIVGNGPSLDKQIDSLRSNQSKHVVVSCGSALATLLRNDIVPDIHVEMERSLFTANVQQNWLDSSKLKNTLLLALNTVSPDTTTKFANCLIFVKANDLGGYLVSKSHSEKVEPLYYCNPTVTNFALSACLYLGANNITLLGCDYGYRDNQKHHSHSSDYYSDNSRLKHAKFVNEFIVKDNFGRNIYTTRIFDLARKHIEEQLRRHPDTKVTNCSDGAMIKHTIYRPSFSEYSKQFDKRQLISEVVQHKRANNSGSKNGLSSLALDSLFYVINELKRLASPSVPYQSKMNKLKKLTIWIENNLKNNLPLVMMIGEMRYLCLLISGHISRLKPTVMARYWEFVDSQIVEMCSQYEQTLNQFSNGEFYEV